MEQIKSEVDDYNRFAAKFNNRVEPLYPCERKDFQNGRFYVSESGASPSVTSITSVAIPKGEGMLRFFGNCSSYEDGIEKRDIAGYEGTYIHSVIMTLILGMEVDLDNSHVDKDGNLFPEGDPAPVSNAIKKKLMEFVALWEALPVTDILGLELMLYDPAVDYAGTADLIVRVNYEGKPENWLIDWKTGNGIYLSGDIQQIAYKNLWDRLYGGTHGEIDRMFQFQLKSTWRNEPKGAAMLKRLMSNEIKCSPGVWETTQLMYNMLCPNRVPVPKKEYPNKFKLEA